MELREFRFYSQSSRGFLNCFCGFGLPELRLWFLESILSMWLCAPTKTQAASQVNKVKETNNSFSISVYDHKDCKKKLMQFSGH